MSLSSNNSKDIICDSIWFLYQNNLESLEDVIISMGGGGSSGITALTGSGSAIVTGSGLSRNISVDLSSFLTATQINAILNTKQNVLTAGNNISFVGNTINNTYSYTHPATHNITDISGLQTALNAKVNDSQVLTNVIANALFSDTVYSKPANEPIGYITGLQTALDNKIDDSQVLTNVIANALFTDTVYSKPANEPISYITGLQTALTAKVDDSQILTNVPLNALFTDTVYTHPASHSIAEVTGLQTALTAKQDTLTAGTGITISNNTISSTVTGATQAWVAANFLSPLNQGTVAVTAGLSATMSANTFIISVDQNFDRRNLFILEDSNSVLRNITTNTAGELLYDNSALSTVSDVSLKQDTLVNYTETTGSTTTIVQTMDDIPAPSINLAWTSGSYTNVSGSHQVIDYVSVYHTFWNLC